MMHKFFRFTLLVTLMAGALSVSAQKMQMRRLNPVAKVPKSSLKPMPKPKATTGLEYVTEQPTAVSVPASNSIFRSLTEEIIGNTTYDVQFSGSESSRVYAYPNGDVSAVWTMSLQPEVTGVTYSDRGTGYNHYTNGAWGGIPTTRLENVRTGFSNLVVTEDGTEFTVAHRGVDASHYRLTYTRRTAGSSTVTQGDIPTNAPNGQLWAKAVADGNTIYVIALSTVVEFGGVKINGVDGQIMFYRSKDAGLTWDIQDAIIPGLDNTAFAQLSQEVYAIAARDGLVAVCVADSWNDWKVVKSFDGGDSWNDPITIIDFPLVNYVEDSGYTVDDIGGADPNAPVELAIFNTDGCVSMLIDPLANIQIFSGETYVLDDNLTDGGSSYYPGINGLMWWNEADPENLYEIAGALDPNGNDTLDFTANSIVGYGAGLSSMPAAATDENGYIYVLYSAGLENVYDINGKAFRHLYGFKSQDLGASWSFPVDITYATDPDPDSLTAKISEAVYPSADKTIKNGKMHFVYQRDYLAGTAVQTTGNQSSLSEIVYVADAEIVNGTKSPALNNIGLSLNPNPASDFTQLSFTLSQKGNATIEIMDLAGAVVRTIHSDNLLIGGQVTNLNTTTLNNGIYFVKVRSGNQQGVKKLVVMH